MAGLTTTLRPRSLEEVVGHEEQIAAIKAILNRPRKDIPQAWLFSGPPGVGKTTLARIIASYLGANSLSLIEINVGQDKGIQMVRDLTSRLNYLPPGAKILAIILDEVHELTEAAKNALLKPIEEPPSHVFWFLCTTELLAVSQPILSRCLQFELKPLSLIHLQEVVLRAAEHLKLPISEQEIVAIAQAAKGSARTALSILDRVKDFIGKPEFFHLVKADVEAVKTDLEALTLALFNADPSIINRLEFFSNSTDWLEVQKTLARNIVRQVKKDPKRTKQLLTALLSKDFRTFGYPALVAFVLEVILNEEKQIQKTQRRIMPR